MGRRVLAALFAVFVFNSIAATAQPNDSYQAGAADRAGFEQWFGDLAGDYRTGAAYWATHRSDAREAHCVGTGDRLQGCLAAQRRLAAFDARRRSDPGYRLGWNSAPPPQPTGGFAEHTSPQRSNPPGSGYIDPPGPGPHVPAFEPTRPSASSGQGQPDGGHWGVLLIAGVMAVCAVAGLIVKVQLAKARRRTATAIAFDEIGQKAHLLHVRREQLTQPDFYGTIDTGKWEKEKASFVQSRIIPLLNAGGMGALIAGLLPAIFAEVEAASRRPAAPAMQRRRSDPDTYSPDMDPVHYEMHCARQLEKAGWATKATPLTGDQGADILAERGGVTLVVQCKLYSSNVGNGAVQEVVAARIFHRANLAAVVSNAAFTRSARDLAGMSDVTLLHHSQLSSYVGPASSRRPQGLPGLERLRR